MIKTSLVNKETFRVFFIPLFVLGMILTFLFGKFFLNFQTEWLFLLWFALIVGSSGLIADSIRSVQRKEFALDYIAIVAILTGVLTQQYLVAAVIVLMMSGGETLEKYSMYRAKNAHTKLVNRLPQIISVKTKSGWENRKTENVMPGEEVLVRKGEVIPLDGELLEEAEIDESSLTGESDTIAKAVGEKVRSGTVATGGSFRFIVTKPQSDSTYNQIIKLVQKAQAEKSPFLRIADKYSFGFTVVTFVLAFLAWYYSGGDWNRVLAVLVVATPCPLILATPIALIGGMSSLARYQIILKRLVALEKLSRVKTIIFDKTGTLTLGKPEVVEVESLSEKTKNDILAIAVALEHHSLHPVAKSIINYARNKKITPCVATKVQEIKGKGLSGQVNGKQFSVFRESAQAGIVLKVVEGDKSIGLIRCEDEIKHDTSSILSIFINLKFKILLLTGDTKERTAAFLKKVDPNISVKSECTPEDKMRTVKEERKRGVVAMVGDGLNDAPSLAAADVGLVFSHQEQTAATQAGDVILLSASLKSVLVALKIAHSTMRIALQSIWVGLGLSIFAMILAVFGYLPPLYGSLIQELIDVAVIINALRATSLKNQ